MADTGLVRRPALFGIALPSPPEGPSIEAAPASCRFVFRGDADALGTSFGPDLPKTPCRATSLRNRAALWLGPDEWLLVAPGEEATEIRRALDLRSGGRTGGIAVEVSDAYAGLVIAGPRVADTLNAGCPLDLDIDAFPQGTCTRTIFGKAEIVLWRTAAAAFRVECGRSFAPYVVGLLAEALHDTA